MIDPIKYAFLTINSQGNPENLVEDYSGGSAETATYRPLAGEVWEVFWIGAFLVGDGIKMEEYANAGTLTNGITFNIVKNADTTEDMVWDLTPFEPIMRTTDYISSMRNTSYFIEGSGDYVKCSEDIPPGALIVDGDNVYEFRANLNDNFTLMDRHHFRVGLKRLA